MKTTLIIGALLYSGLDMAIDKTSGGAIAGAAVGAGTGAVIGEAA